MDTLALEQYLHIGMAVGFLLLTTGGFSWGRTSMFSVRAHLWFWSILTAGVVADLGTKHFAFGCLEPGHPVAIIPQMLDLRLSLNPGASGGADINVVEWTRTAAMGCMAVVVLFLVSRRDLRWLHIALALFLAGGLGNTLDRTYFMRAETIRYQGSNGPKVIAVSAHRPSYRGLVVRMWGDAEPRIVRWNRRPEVVGERGAVRDFIGIWQPAGKEYTKLHIINVADIMLTAGPLIIIVLGLNVVLNSLRKMLQWAATPNPPS